MGHNLTHLSKNRPSTVVTRTIDHLPLQTPPMPSMPASLSTTSLSCLAAEYHQVRDQDGLDAWRVKALHLVSDLYEHKASWLRQEGHMNVLLGQLRLMIDEEMPRYAQGHLMDDQRIRQIEAAANAFK